MEFSFIEDGIFRVRRCGNCKYVFTKGALNSWSERWSKQNHEPDSKKNVQGRNVILVRIVTNKKEKEYGNGCRDTEEDTFVGRTIEAGVLWSPRSKT
jgi:hypothetical protein